MLDRAVPNPWEVESRKPLTPQQKAKMFIAYGGICCICGCRINHAMDAWDEHINPLWLSGNNEAPNRGPAHERCAKPKTTREAALRAKVRNAGARFLGAKKTQSRPMMGSKASGWKRLFNGTWERRK